MVRQLGWKYVSTVAVEGDYGEKVSLAFFIQTWEHSNNKMQSHLETFVKPKETAEPPQKSWVLCWRLIVPAKQMRDIRVHGNGTKVSLNILCVCYT